MTVTLKSVSPLSCTDILVSIVLFRAAVEKLHCVDDAFRRQLESLQASHQAELLRLANDKQKQIEQANQRVLQKRHVSQLENDHFLISHNKIIVEVLQCVSVYGNIR